MISLRSGLCILAGTGVSLRKVVLLGIHTNVNTYAAVSYWSCFVSTPASSLDEGATVEDSYAQRKDGKRDSDLLDSRIE